MNVCVCEGETTVCSSRVVCAMESRFRMEGITGEGVEEISSNRNVRLKLLWPDYT